MGQGASTQQQAQNGAETPRHDERGGKLKSSGVPGIQQQPSASLRNDASTSRHVSGSSSHGHTERHLRSGDRLESSGKPRRKSLDMPDMSLAMTGTGLATAATTGVHTPSVGIAQAHQSGEGLIAERHSPNYNRYSNALAAERAPYRPSSGQSSATLTPQTAASSGQHPSVDDSTARAEIGGEDGSLGLPMANGPLYGSQGQEESAANSQVAAASKTSGWSRWKDKSAGGSEGFGKKAQPVTGAPDALHALGHASHANADRTSRPPLLQPIATQGRPNSAQIAGGIAQSTTAPAARGDNKVAAVMLDESITPTSLSPTTALPNLPPWQSFATAAALQSDATIQAGDTSMTETSTSVPPILMPPIPTPLKQPTETILAPEVPPDVNIIVPPLIAAEGAHDIIEPSAALALGMHEAIGALAAVAAASGGIITPTTMSGITLPALTPAANPSHSSPIERLPANVSAVVLAAANAVAVNNASGHSTGHTTPSAGFASPLIPGSTPPMGNPPNTLPAAASIAALNPNLAQDPKAQEAVQAATVDLGAGPDGVPTLLTWKAEEQTSDDPSKPTEGAHQVFVTGTFANGWNTKIELRPKLNEEHKQTSDFTALVKLPPGPHSLKFIVDKQWKTSKFLPSATDADGHLINYLQVHKPDQNARYPTLPPDAQVVQYAYESEEDEDEWTTEVPPVLSIWGDASEAVLAAREAAELADQENFGHAGGASMPAAALPQLSSAWSESPPRPGASLPPNMPHPAAMILQRHPFAKLQTVQPPAMPAQLEKGVLNGAVLVAKGSGDDNSILAKPDHSVLNHLAAAPIKGGLLSVGVTTRYRRKYVTTVYYKKPILAETSAA